MLRPRSSVLLSLGLAPALVLAGCSGTSRSKRNPVPRAALTFPQGTAATAKSDQNGIVVATVGGNSTETQIVKASASSAVKDVLVAFPPGSLAISTDVVVQEGSQIA